MAKQGQPSARSAPLACHNQPDAPLALWCQRRIRVRHLLVERSAGVLRRSPAAGECSYRLCQRQKPGVGASTSFQAFSVKIALQPPIQQGDGPTAAPSRKHSRANRGRSVSEWGGGGKVLFRNERRQRGSQSKYHGGGPHSAVAGEPELTAGPEPQVGSGVR